MSDNKALHQFREIGSFIGIQDSFKTYLHNCVNMSLCLTFGNFFFIYIYIYIMKHALFLINYCQLKRFYLLELFKNKLFYLT